MEKLVNEYLIFMHNIKQVSENTFKSYSRDMEKFILYLNARGIYDFKNVDMQMLQEYITYQKNMGYAASTITRSFIAIKSFYGFLCHIDYMDHNPAGTMKLPRPEGRPNAVLKKDEMEKLLKPPVVVTLKGLRDRAMLLLLYYTKISILELVKLKVSAIDFSEQRLCCEQGGVKRSYLLNDETSMALHAYLDFRQIEEGADDWLFSNRYGEALSRQGFWKAIKNYAKEAGIEKEITLYSIKQGEL